MSWGCSQRYVKLPNAANPHWARPRRCSSPSLRAARIPAFARLSARPNTVAALRERRTAFVTRRNRPFGHPSRRFNAQKTVFGTLTSDFDGLTPEFDALTPVLDALTSDFESLISRFDALNWDFETLNWDFGGTPPRFEALIWDFMAHLPAVSGQPSAFSRRNVPLPAHSSPFSQSPPVPWPRLSTLNFQPSTS